MLLGTPLDDTLSKMRNLANKNHNVNILIEKNISYILNKKYFLVWAVVLLPKLCDKNMARKSKKIYFNSQYSSGLKELSPVRKHSG